MSGIIIIKLRGNIVLSFFLDITQFFLVTYWSLYMSYSALKSLLAIIMYVLWKHYYVVVA